LWCWPIHDHFRSFQRDHPAADHGIELGQNRPDLFFRLDALDGDWHVERKHLNPVAVNLGVRSERHGTSQNGGAREMPFSEEPDDFLVGELSVVLIGLAHENAHEHPFACELLHHSSVALDSTLWLIADNVRDPSRKGSGESFSGDRGAISASLIQYAVYIASSFDTTMKKFLLAIIPLLAACSSENPIEPVDTTGVPAVDTANTYPILFSSLRDTTYSNRLEVIATKADGSGFVNLSRDPANDTDPSWSPDGELIAFASDRSGSYDIYIIKADGSGVRRLTFETVDERRPRWSPDGAQILFESGRDGLLNQNLQRTLDIFLIDSDGAHVVNLTKTPSTSETWASMSPDGKTVSFTRSGSIMLINSDGTNERRLHAADSAFSDDVAAWSPDGATIAYSTFNQNHPFYTDTYVIFTVKPDGTDIKRITGLGYSSARFPSWSPDGSRILYNRDGVDETWGRFRTQNLWIMNPDGSNNVQITTDHSARNELGGPQAWTK
jgi:Tol biopolymer transport system component